MAFYRQVGSVPPKRHTQHCRPDGELYYEELIGEEAVPVPYDHSNVEAALACEDGDHAWTWAGRVPQP